MYRRLMYNDDCILDTTTNTVIFNFEDDWNKYLDWKSKAQNWSKDKQDFNKRKNILLWNGGLPHNVKDFKLFNNCISLLKIFMSSDKLEIFARASFRSVVLEEDTSSKFNI